MELQVFKFTFDATTIIVLANTLKRAYELAKANDNNIHLDENNKIRYRWSPTHTEQVRVFQHNTESIIHSVSH